MYAAFSYSPFSADHLLTIKIPKENNSPSNILYICLKLLNYKITKFLEDTFILLTLFNAMLNS